MARRECSYPRLARRTTRRGSGRCHVHRYADRGSRMLTTHTMAPAPPSLAIYQRSVRTPDDAGIKGRTGCCRARNATEAAAAGPDSA